MTLREASEAEKAARDALTFEAWGKGLDAAGWAAREAELRAHPWAKAAMRTWLLEDEGRVLSSLETFVVPSRWRTERGVERGETWEIASVYTEPALRGRGHAGALLAELGALARARPEVQALLLFSDVGEAIYRRAGYLPLDRQDWVIAPISGGPLEEADALLTEVSDGELSRALALVESPFALRPSAAQLDWALLRSRIYARARGMMLPKVCGARAGTGIAYWRVDPPKRSLEILLLAATSDAQAHALLRTAARIAFSAGLSEVRLWNSGLPSGVRPPEDASGEERRGSWPMIAPLREGIVEDLRYLPRALWV